MNKRCLRAALSACLALMLLLTACGALASGEFLVTESEPAGSGSLWLRLFGVEEDASGERDADSDTAYRAALEELLNGSTLDAMNSFSRLGKYRDSVKLTDYASAWLSYLRGDPSTAKAGFDALGDFADAAFRAELCDAMALHRVRVDGKFGYANLKGETVVAPQYDWAERAFRDESRAQGHGADALKAVAVVFVGTTKLEDGDLVPDAGLYGLIGQDGEVVAQPVYDAVLWTANGLAALGSGEQVLLIDIITGDQVGARFDEALMFSEGYVPVRQGDKWAFISASGEYVPGGFIWDSALPFSEGLAAVSQDKLYGFIDASGQVVVPLEYQNAHSFGEGLAGVRWKKKWGFIDAAGNVVLENAYGDTGVFSRGACAVKKGKKYGLIDRQGELITKYQYDEITPFEKMYPRAWIRINKLWGLVSPTGTVVLKPTWGSHLPFGTSGMSRVSYRNKYGYIDVMGVPLIQSRYDMAAPFAAGRGGVLNAEGQVEYLDRFSRGFTVDGSVPTEAVCGFIEGRRLGEKTVTDAETGKETTEQTIAFRLYHVDGSAITGWAE